jgi:hypothetical protein
MSNRITEYPDITGKSVTRARVYHDDRYTANVELVFTDNSRLSLRFEFKAFIEHEGSFYSSSTRTPEDNLEDFLIRRHGPVVLGLEADDEPTSKPPKATCRTSTRNKR